VSHQRPIRRPHQRRRAVQPWSRRYSMDLRSRLLKDANAGLSSKELAELYHVSRA
jgi:hypothetical protein